MNIKLIKVMLFFILILAFIIRVWDINNYPVGFNADEAALGYNAYSIIHTGRDEYGSLLPLSFKSFGDYKPGLYVYLDVPFVIVLGLNELAVRLPSVIFGTLTVFLIYLLGKKIFKSESVGLFSAGLLAITPWHIHFSRGAWETNVATFFISLGVYLFLIGLEKWKYLFWSLLSFLLSMYTYQSPRLIVPIFILGLLVLYRKDLIKWRNGYVKYIIVLILLAIPLLMQFTGGGGNARFNGLSIFSDTGPESRMEELRGEHKNIKGIQALIFHNKLIVYGLSFLGHYLDHFKPDFLFVNGDPLIRNKVPDTGELYLIEALFLVLGLVLLINGLIKDIKILLVWILISPLASALTYQTPHALRALSMVIPLTLVIGYGVTTFFQLLNRRLRKIALMVILLIFSFEFMHYLDQYYVHYPKRYPLAWEYGFREMVGKLNQYQDQYKKIVITDRYDQPYILVLFYTQYDPKKYQPQAVLSPRDKFNFGTVRSFDKYEFRPITASEVKTAKNILFIGTPEEIPQDANIIDRVNFLNNQPAFIFRKT